MFPLRAVAIALAVGAAALVVAATSIPARAVQSVTSTVLEDEVIEAFAVDGSRIAWASGDPSGGTCPRVKVRKLPRGSAAVVGNLDGGDGCHIVDHFALAGSQVVWAGFVDCCNHGYGSVTLAQPGARERSLRSLSQDYHSWGDFPTGVSGGGTTLVYAVATVSLLKELDSSRGAFHCLPRDPCTWRVTAGGVWRVEGRSAGRIPGGGPAALVAAASGRVALVPASGSVITCSATATRCPRPLVSAGAAVTIRSATSGSIVARFAPRGRVVAISLDDRVAAVLVADRSFLRLERYRIVSGARLDSTRVPASTAYELDASGGHVVFRAAKRIFFLARGRSRPVAVASARAAPIGLSIEGRRVLWAENLGRRGFVRQVVVD